MSWIVLSVSRSLARSVDRNASSSTASSRSWIRSSATSGRSSQARRSRPPIERHRPVDLVQQRAGRAAVDGFDHFEVAQRGRIDEQAVGAGAKRDLAHVREIRLLRVAQVVDERAGGAHRGRTIVEAESGEALRPQLVEQRSPRRLLIERPCRQRSVTRAFSRTSRDQRRRVVESPSGATISRGCRMASSSASAWRPSAP